MRRNVYGITIIIAMLSLPHASLACGMGGGGEAAFGAIALGIKAVIDAKNKFKEQEKTLEALTATYAKDDPEAAGLAEKVKGYDTKLGALNTQYRKLEDYLRSKLPVINKKTEEGESPVTETDSVSTSKADTPAEPEKKASRWGGALNKAKNVFKRQKPDSSEGSTAVDKTGVEPAQVTEADNAETAEEEDLTKKKSSLQSEIEELTTNRHKANGELETLLSNKYPDYKSELERLLSLKKSYNSTAAETGAKK